jgi:tetratricopeptide (TPR) repeat protein
MGNRGTVLITTRNPDLRQYGSAGTSRVDQMSSEDAITLLLKTAMLKDTEDVAQKRPAAEVVDVLGRLALAIIQAGAVIRQQLCSIAGFCDLYSQQKKELLESGRPLPDHGYAYSIYTTWEISIRKIEKRSDNHAKFALELLRLFSFMHFDGIDETIFQKAMTNRVKWPYPNGDILDGSMLIEMMPSGWDQMFMSKALGVLIAFSLVTVNEDRQISMHPLVHEWSRNRMPEKEHRHAWKIATSLLAMSIFLDYRGGLEWCRQRRLVLPHIDVCLGYNDGELFSEGTNLEERLDIAFKFAFAYHEIGRSGKAYDLQVQVQKCAEKNFPPEHPRRLCIMIHAIMYLTALLRYDEAIELQIEFIELAEKTMKTHFILGGMSTLGFIYSKRGENERAMEQCRRGLERFKDILGDEHLQVLNTFQTITSVQLAMGKSREAVKTAEKVFNSHKKLFGEQYSSTLSARQLLADAYGQAGRNMKAKILQSETICQLHEIYGPNHPRTVGAQAMLAQYHAKPNRPLLFRKKGMLVYRRQALEGLKALFGETDPRTLECMELLANDYFNCFMWEKAEKVQEIVTREMVRTFGKAHERTEYSLRFLARIRKFNAARKAIYWWVPKKYLR